MSETLAFTCRTLMIATARDLLRPPRPTMLKRLEGVTCDDCYFRREGLCALSPEAPCPTFRPFTQGSFAPPPQPRHAPQLGRLAAQYAAAS